MSRPGEQNARWKGGTWVNSSGYVMVLVGREHPMASCRAYAKRCRLVCYETHGPPPTPEHHAHHINGDKTDDRPENLEWREASDHGRHHLSSKRAKEIGAKGGRKTARLRRRAQREQKHQAPRRPKKRTPAAA
jgi:hypothetical protein